MFVKPKHIHRHCKVFTLDTICDVLQTLHPLGWAVYGDSFTEVELASLADYIGSRFSSMGGSFNVKTYVVDDPIECPDEVKYQTEYSYQRGRETVSEVYTSIDPDFKFYDRTGIKRVLNHQSWDVHGPTHVVLPQRLLSSSVPEMFDVNVLFIKEPKKLEMVRTQSLKAPIFVCYAEGVSDVA